MTRRPVTSVIFACALCGAFAASASAANPVRLELDQGSAFAVVGHSCGGIQEKVYARGFAANGYPQGNVYLSTTCGGSGRGGGGTSTTYTGTASVVWTWFGETRSHGALEGPLEATEASDSYGDRVYNVGTAAYLETGSPPLQPPAAPANIAAGVALAECGEGCEYLRMTVSWAEAPETERLVKYSTISAVPVGSSAPTLTTSTSSNYFRYAYLSPVEPNTTYRVTVTNTDAEGTSEASAPIEIKSPNSDGESEKEHKSSETCTLNHGTIHLSPGLTETPAIQSMTVGGELSGCNGPLDFESGKYTAHLLTTEAVTCSALSSASLEGTKAKSLSVKWLPLESGTSKGSLVLPLSEAPLTGMTGTMIGGPFASATSFKAEAVSESFKGAALCGVPQGKLQTIKPVKAGVFSTSEVEFG